MEANSATGSKFYNLITAKQDFISERSQTWTPSYSVVNVTDDSFEVTTYDADTGKVLDGSSSYKIVKKAEDTKKEAYALKSQYESALGGAKEESTRIIGQAKKDAKAEYDRILDEADQAAGKLMKDARETIDLEKEKTLRDMQSEVAALAVSAAKKMVKQQYGADADQAAYDQFLKEAGDAHDDK